MKNNFIFHPRNHRILIQLVREKKEKSKIIIPETVDKKKVESDFIDGTRLLVGEILSLSKEAKEAGFKEREFVTFVADTQDEILVDEENNEVYWLIMQHKIQAVVEPKVTNEIKSAIMN